MDYRIGSIILYKTFGGTLREVEVTNKEDDIKNGRPGFDGKIIYPDGEYGHVVSVWGYDDQIVKVIGY